MDKYSGKKAELESTAETRIHSANTAAHKGPGMFMAHRLLRMERISWSSLPLLSRLHIRKGSWSLRNRETYQENIVLMLRHHKIWMMCLTPRP